MSVRLSDQQAISKNNADSESMSIKLMLCIVAKSKKVQE